MSLSCKRGTSKTCNNLFIYLSNIRQRHYQKHKRSHKCKKNNKSISLLNQKIKGKQLIFIIKQEKGQIMKCCSVPHVTAQSITCKLKATSSDKVSNKHLTHSKTNDVKKKSESILNGPFCQNICTIFRCQIGTTEKSSCCACNSDAMFEVMKSLYDCYKTKDCKHCNCILCGHLPREQRRKGEMRKKLSKTSVGVATPSPAERVEKEMESKTPEEKEQILKRYAKQGIALPKGKTVSEKSLVKRVRKDLGLPPEPSTRSLKDKLERAEADGIVVPLEGKTPAEKEKILRREAAAGIPLPEGKTASEKALIKKIRAETPPDDLHIPPEKLKKAKAAGLLTPLDGKSPKEQEKIVRGLAELGIPLPEVKTPSQKKLIDKIHKDMGLPPEPDTKSMKAKYNKAEAAGIIVPLEGKTHVEKEAILRREAAAGIPLPEGKTASEKALIKKIQAETPTTPAKIPSAKLRKAKTAGLLTPLDGKSPKEQEKVIRGLAELGIPLPEAKTPSQKKLIDKVHKDMGLPPEPDTKSMKAKYDKAQAAGIIESLEGKTPAEKEKILRREAAAGIPLPEGKTASEKVLIKKIQAETPPDDLHIPPEKLKKAKAAGLLTPLDDKSPKEQEKIIRGLAELGIPLPEAKTPSQKKLIDKVYKDMGLPPEPDTKSMKAKYDKAKAAGIIVPLEGKTPAEKETILRREAAAGIPLPEGKTASEKALIEKIQTEMPTTPAKIPSEKLRKAKTAGLLTPLDGKTSKEQEKIIRGLAELGIPLPEAKTPSQKKLIDKVHKDMGLPPAPDTKSMKAKYDKAEAAGIIVPLEGKTHAEKEKILRREAAAGIPLPEGKTASEKVLIKKIQAETPPDDLHIPPEKLKKAKAAGLLTPLDGKSPKEQEKIIRGLAKLGIPLPEAKTPSQKKIIDEVYKDMGLPPAPDTKSMKAKYDKAQAAGIIESLEGKTRAEKEKILRREAAAGIPLPEGKTASEKALIKKIQAEMPTTPAKIPSEKLRKAKAAGLLTPLDGKTPKQQEKIIRGLAELGIPLPEAKTPSQKKLIDKVRKDMGLPPEPDTKLMKAKYDKAEAAGIIESLEGKTHAEKEKILRREAAAGIPLPEGKTASEKVLIKKIQAETPPDDLHIPPEILKKAKAAGLLTPLDGKSPKEQEKIIRGLAKLGIPLPEAKTPSQKKIIDEVYKDMGLPPAPDTKSMKAKYDKAQAAGIIESLEGKTPAEKETILRREAAAGIPLPEGKTASEKVLIKKIQAEMPTTLEKIPSAKLRKAKTAGLLTPLDGKTPKEQEKIIRGLAELGIPLPEAKTPSQKKLIDKVNRDMGLPSEPETKSMKAKYDKAKAAGIIVPLEGKTHAEKEKILRREAAAGIPLPEGKTASEKALIKKIQAETPPDDLQIPPEKLKKAKAAGLLTPLDGKSPKEQEKIIRGLAKLGIPLPEAKTPSQKKLIDKVYKDMGLPPEPDTKSMKAKYDIAQAAGIIVPLEGKTPAEKENILRREAAAGIPLPEGKTASEKALIKKIQAEMPTTPAKIPSEKLRKAKAAGLLTPLDGKTPKQQEKVIRGLAKLGIPLPEAKTPSQKRLIDKVNKDMGLPPAPDTKSMKAKYDQAEAAGIIVPLEGKTHAEKEKILRREAAAGIPLPEGKTASEKVLIKKIQAETPPDDLHIPPEKLKKAKAAGLLTPLDGKSPKEQEKVIRGLVELGIPLPEAKTPSQKKLIDKVYKDMGLPPEPDTKSMKAKYDKAQAAGIIESLEGKTPAEKENILRREAAAGIPLPEGKTASEKALIKKIQAEMPTTLAKIPSEKLRKAKAAGLLTPLDGKTPKEQEKVIRGLAKLGIPLPETKTPSQKKLIEKVYKDMGLPPEPDTKSMKAKYDKAQAAGIIESLEGKTPAEKENILRREAAAGIPLPEGKTASDKALIKKIQAEMPTTPAKIPSEKLRKAKAAGLLTPLDGKTPKEQEKVIRGLAKLGIPLPETKTPSQKKLIDKVYKDMGLPPAPDTKSMKAKYDKAEAAGIIVPLEGKTPAEKEAILRREAAAGIPLPEGKTASEKALINKIQAETPPDDLHIPPEKLKKAKAAGLLTPLYGKSPKEQEKIIRGLAELGIPLPDVKTPSQKKLIDKVYKDMGLPPEPETNSMKAKYDKAKAAGIIVPLKGKTPAEKEKILRREAAAGIPLPEGKTASEKALIKKIQAETPPDDLHIPPEKLKKAKAAGLLTPLDGKSPKEQEKVIRGLAELGIPLPEAKTPSQKKLIDKVYKDMGLPPEPDTKSMKAKYDKAQAAGIIESLEGKTPAEKENILRREAAAGIPLPEGKTASEKALIKKIQAEMPTTPAKIPSEKLRKAKAAGLLTPLDGKTPKEQEKVIRGLAKLGIPLPEAKTPSQKKLIDKVYKDMGLPPEPDTKSMKAKYDKAQAAGIIESLEGKTPAEKENILRREAAAGIPLPEGKTASEKALIKKIQAEIPTTPAKIPSEKLRKAKAAGLLTPLDGKTPKQQEKIIRGLAKLGIPLPEATTPSEKKLIDKVNKDMGLPPEPETKSMKAKYDKAKAAGIIVPLEGKTPAEKEAILRREAAAGISLPEGKTASEKALIAKIQAEIPMDILEAAERKGDGEPGMKAKVGITEDIEEIVKTTKCDRACGCDKKKIRFKHSYVKIKVTSPDISSFCSCPNECLPGVKGGVFVDNEGIKVTVGSVLEIPSFWLRNENKGNDLKKYNFPFILNASIKDLLDTMEKSVSNMFLKPCDAHHDINPCDMCETTMKPIYYNDACVASDSNHSFVAIDDSDSFSLTPMNQTDNELKSHSSFISNLICATESSLSFFSDYASSNKTANVTSSQSDSTRMSGSDHFESYQKSKSRIRNIIMPWCKSSYSGVQQTTVTSSKINMKSGCSSSNPKVTSKASHLRKHYQNNVVPRIWQRRLKCLKSLTYATEYHEKSIHIIMESNMNSDEEITRIIDEILVGEENNKSFLILVSSDEGIRQPGSMCSSICFKLSKNFSDYSDSFGS